MTGSDEERDRLRDWLDAAADALDVMSDGAFDQAMQDAVSDFNRENVTNFDPYDWAELMEG